MAINPTLYKKISYDPVKDFQPIAMLAHLPFILVVNNDLPVKSVAELIEYAKDHPGKLSFGSGGVGASHHLYGELFKSLTGTQMTHVPYKGTMPALNDLIAGHIQVLFADSPPVLPQIEGGKVRALGVTTAKRIPAAPEIPTIAETVPSFVSAPWQMLSAPNWYPSVGDRQIAQGDHYLCGEPGGAEEADGHGPGSWCLDPSGRACEVRHERSRRLGPAGAEGRRGGDRVKMRLPVGRLTVRTPKATAKSFPVFRSTSVS